MTTGSTKLNNNLFAVNFFAVHVFQSFSGISSVKKLNESLVLFPWSISQFPNGTERLEELTESVSGDVWV